MPSRVLYDVVRCSAGFISKFAIIPPKKQVVKIRKIEADSDSNGDKNHTCSRQQTKINSTFLLHVNYSQLLMRNIYFFVFMYLVFNCVDIVRCPVKFMYNFKFHGARMAFGRVNEGKMTSAGHRTVSGQATFESYDINFLKKIVRCSSDVCKRRPGAVRTPCGARPMSFHPQTSSGTVRCLQN